MASANAKKILVFALIIIAMMAPVVLASMAGKSAWASPWLYGSFATLTAAMMSEKLGLVLAAATAGSVAVATLLHPYPFAGGAFVGLLTFGAALTARRGLHSAALMVPLFTSFAVAAPTQLGVSDMHVVNALAMGLIALLGGLWTVGVKRVILGHLSPVKPKAHLQPRTALIYATTIGVVVGVASWAILTWAPTHQGAWLILTFIVVLQPSPNDTLHKALQRMGGTVIGVVVAAAISLFGPSATVALALSTLLLFAASIVFFVYQRPYWEFVALLTPAIILADSAGSHVDDVAANRLVFTILGGAIALMIAIAIKVIFDRWFSGSTPTNA